MKALMSKRGEDALRSGEPFYIEVVPRPMRMRRRDYVSDVLCGVALGFLIGCMMTLVVLSFV